MGAVLVLLCILVGIAIIAEISSFIRLVKMSQTSAKHFLDALAAEKEAEFTTILRAYLENERKMAPFIFSDNVMPMSDEEYYSFLYYIYLPLSSELRERLRRVNRKMLRLKMLCCGVLLLFSVVALFRGESAGYFLLILCLLAMGVILFIDSIFKKAWKKGFLMRREMEKKIIYFNHGIAPPPYRIQLETVIAKVNDFLATKMVISKEALGEYAFKPQPKSWSQTARDMFPRGARNPHGEDRS